MYLEIFQRHGARHRMARIGITVHELFVGVGIASPMR